MALPLHLLLEFDQSLPDWSTSPFIEALQISVEDCQSPETPDQYSVENLRQIFNLFQYSDDVFLTCANCGGFLSNVEDYKSCCQKYTRHASLSESHLSYWLILFTDPLKAVTLLPNYTYMLFLQHGGPPIQFRRLLWRRILINQTRLTQTCEVFEELQKRFNEEADKQISKDLKRTFPEISFFKGTEASKDLSTILNVYANYDVELGYCQGLLFLVAVLYYQFNQDCQFTLHALIQIMGSNPELHEIFCSHSMGSRLGIWYHEFLVLLQRGDPELADHLSNNINADFLVFLYQWWLSFMSAHTPDTSIVYKVIDFCQFHMNWKRGFFKISLGLLLKNKHLLMSFDDCEIVYRHLLSENKWGASISFNLDAFFGDYLMSFPNEWFEFSSNDNDITTTRHKPQLNMSLLLNTFKKLQLYTPTRHSNHSNESNDSNNSTLSSIFTRNNNEDTTESLYSTDTSSTALSTANERNYFELLRMPMLGGGGNKATQDELELLKMENVQLKCLLGSLVTLMKDGDISPSLRLQVQKYL